MGSKRVALKIAHYLADAAERVQIKDSDKDSRLKNHNINTIVQ